MTEAECWKAEADTLRRIVMEALAERMSLGWQPIETAPKDGSTVDLWWDHVRFAECFWMNGNRAFPSRQNGWICTRNPAKPFSLTEIRAVPTHWLQPNLPEKAPDHWTNRAREALGIGQS